MASDPKCSTCAYRVNERRSFHDAGFVAGMTMVCLHPAIGRQDCAAARLSSNAKCGQSADLWQQRAA